MKLGLYKDKGFMGATETDPFGNIDLINAPPRAAAPPNKEERRAGRL